MIPSFPNFVKLHPSHKNLVEEITHKFPPYSDHNFTSLLMWDVNLETEFSLLNQNLVIRFKDYESDNIFFSFIGNNLPEQTIETLIEFSEAAGHGAEIFLLPQDNFNQDQITSLAKKYLLVEDRNNFDYILNTEELATLAGSKYLNKRNKLNQFQKKHLPKIVIQDLKDLNFQKQLIDCFDRWVNSTRVLKGAAFVNQDEIKAFKKLIDHHPHLNIMAIAVYINGILEGFSLFEIINQDYAQHPIQKGNKNYQGIYEFLYNNLAKYLHGKGIKYLNIYQDLGHEGLRKAKMDYNPTFLKKYKLSKKLTDQNNPDKS